MAQNGQFSLWACSGFYSQSSSLLHAENGAVTRNLRAKPTNGNTAINLDQAPSVNEADEILARFGYVDAEVAELV